MKYVYIIMTIAVTEQGEEIIPSTPTGIPEVYTTREECRGLEDDEFLMAVPVQGKNYPLGY